MASARLPSMAVAHWPAIRQHRAVAHIRVQPFAIPAPCPHHHAESSEALLLVAIRQRTRSPDRIAAHFEKAPEALATHPKWHGRLSDPQATTAAVPHPRDAPFSLDHGSRIRTLPQIRRVCVEPDQSAAPTRARDPSYENMETRCSVRNRQVARSRGQYLLPGRSQQSAMVDAVPTAVG